MTPTDSYVIPKGFIAILSFAFAVEGALYSAVTPILPLLSRRFDLTDTIAGVLLSSSSTGHVAGSLIRVLILARSNARDVAVGAMAALAITTILFAWADTSTILLWARHGQGVAAGIACTACILWLLSAWPIVRRGVALGAAMGPAVIGTVAGPSIGTLALQLGVRMPYTVVALACLAAAAWLLRMPPPARGRAPRERQTKARRDARPTALLGAGVAALAGAVIGLVNLSGPLVLRDLGAPDQVSGLTFLAAPS